MSKRSFYDNGGKSAAATKGAGPSGKSPEEVVRELKASSTGRRGPDYRERSLKLHGNLCAHCGMVFEGKNLKLLTVHHKDSNPHNNPPDGSNWENLCVYCHDNVHSRELLGDYNDGAKGSGGNERVYEDKPAASGMGTLGDLLASKLKG